MEIRIIEITLGIFSIVLQLLAAYFGYRIYKFNRMSKWWLALVLAFIVQGIRRIFTTLADMGNSTFLFPSFVDRALMFVISLLMVIGVWAMMKNFENFEVVEKQTKRKLVKLK